MAEKKDWKSSLCGCFDECGICYCAFFIPCGAFCIHVKVAGHAYGGCCRPCMTACICGCIGCALNRERIRLELGIAGNCCGDCLAWIFCAPCAATQEYREWKKEKGFHDNKS